MRVNGVCLTTWLSKDGWSGGSRPDAEWIHESESGSGWIFPFLVLHVVGAQSSRQGHIFWPALQQLSTSIQLFRAGRAPNPEAVVHRLKVTAATPLARRSSGASRFPKPSHFGNPTSD